MTTYKCCDTETTGIPSETERHALVEVGWADVVGARGSEIVMDPQFRLVNPGRPIPAEASSVHHLRDVDVADGIMPDQACALLVGGDYTVAHVADFEKNFIGGERVWIDTWKCALRIWPDAPSHKLTVLRYWLKFDDNPLFDRALAEPAHRAGADAYCCAFLLIELLKASTVEQLVKWSSGPALLSKCGFGKHRGLKWSEVPKDYLHWIVDKSDISDRDVKATAKYYLKNQIQHEETQRRLAT